MSWVPRRAARVIGSGILAYVSGIAKGHGTGNRKRLCWLQSFGFCVSYDNIMRIRVLINYGGNNLYSNNGMEVKLNLIIRGCNIKLVFRTNGLYKYIVIYAHILFKKFSIILINIEKRHSSLFLMFPFVLLSSLLTSEFRREFIISCFTRLKWSGV